MREREEEEEGGREREDMVTVHVESSENLKPSTSQINQEPVRPVPSTSQTSQELVRPVAILEGQGVMDSGQEVQVMVADAQPDQPVEQAKKPAEQVRIKKRE